MICHNTLQCSVSSFTFLGFVFFYKVCSAFFIIFFCQNVHVPPNQTSLFSALFFFLLVNWNIFMPINQPSKQKMSTKAAVFNPSVIFKKWCTFHILVQNILSICYPSHIFVYTTIQMHFCSGKVWQKKKKRLRNAAVNVIGNNLLNFLLTSEPQGIKRMRSAYFMWHSIKRNTYKFMSQ